MTYEDFLYWDGWFKEFKQKPGGRYYTWKAAFNLFLQRGGQVIVETGCMRGLDDWGAGLSTYLFGKVCKQYNKELYTIDNNPENLDLARDATKEFADNIHFVLSDSVKYLQTFTKPIDFLYLDSLDCPIEEGADSTAAQKHCLKELQLCWSNLVPNAIVLLDDNDWSNGGKTALAKRFLIENNWKVVLDERQSLWIR